MLQPFAAPCDHYGTLPCIDEGICLHARHPRGVSQIPKCLVKKAGDSLEGFERLLLHYSGNSIGVARCMAQRAANRIRLFGVEPIHAVQEPMDSFRGGESGICQGCEWSSLHALHQTSKDCFE